MNIITKYYNYACCLLEDFIPYVPELRLTNAKKYCGQFDKRGQYPVIRISKWNHVDEMWLMDNEDHLEIIDTICHELAHTIEMKHTDFHEKATKAFKKIVFNGLVKLGVAEFESGGVSNAS